MLINEAYSIYVRGRFLNKSQYWTRDKLDKYRYGLLRRMIEHAYTNIPFYHASFKKSRVRPSDIKSISDLKKLPILTKDDVRLNLSRLKNPMKERMTLESTGGSTGEPLKFYACPEMHDWKMAAAHRAWGWAGYRVGRDRLVELWAANFDVNGANDSGSKLRTLLLRRKTLNSFNLSDENMANFTNVIRDYKPKAVRAYASSIYTFAKYARENNITDLKIDTLITTAEKLFDAHRETIEATFGCKVHDGYGNRETALGAHQCEEVGGYHIFEENAVAELVRDGEYISEGESGDMLITDLHNTAMPWLRYQIGDLAEPMDGVCPCGRTLALIKSIEGRVHDVIVTPDGRRVPGEFFPHLFKDVEGIREYRIYQAKKNHLLVEIVRTPAFTEDGVRYLVKHLEEYLGSNIVIEFSFPNRIEWSQSGKRMYTISEVE